MTQETTGSRCCNAAPLGPVPGKPQPALPHGRAVTTLAAKRGSLGVSPAEIPVRGEGIFETHEGG